MNSIEFITLARTLADSETSGPAGYRSAVSRAYYGAFLSVQAMIEIDLALPCKLGTLSEHAVVQRFLLNCQVPEAAELGRLLGNLHEFRKDADYQMADTTYEDRGESRLCVDRADEIMVRLHQCSTMVMRQKIKAGIIQYRRAVNG